MTQDKSRSASPNPPKSPHREVRRRSRSPRRDTNRHARKEGGFKWKEKRRVEEGERNADGGARLERGYKEHYRARSPQRGRDADDREQQSIKADPELPKKEKEKKEAKAKKAAADPAPGEPMIIVHVNDRLGTKAAIPCFASDPISQHTRSSPPRWTRLTTRQNFSKLK
jgi:hypothetical protein